MTTKITFEQMLQDENSMLENIDEIAREISKNSDPARLTALLVELKEDIADLETLRHEIIAHIASTNPRFLATIMNLNKID